MEKKYNGTMLRWVAALLIAGCIVGLVFLYLNLYGNKADGETNDGGGNGGAIVAPDPSDGEDKPKDDDDDKPDVPPVVEISYELPRPFENGRLILGGTGNDRLLEVIETGSGAILICSSDSKEGHFVTRGVSCLSLALFDGAKVTKTTVLSADKSVGYISSAVHREGVTILAEADGEAVLYGVDYSASLVYMRKAGSFDGKILMSDDGEALTLVYSRGGKLHTDRYGYDLSLSERKFCDDSGLPVGVFPYRDGQVVILDNGIYTDGERVLGRLGIFPVAITPYLREGKLSYACLGRNEVGGVFAVLDRDLAILHSESSEDDGLICLDRPITYSSAKGTLTRRCGCGEQLETIKTDIRDVKYIDGERRELYYLSSSGEMKVLNADGISSACAYTFDVAYIGAKAVFGTSYNDGKGYEGLNVCIAEK